MRLFFASLIIILTACHNVTEPPSRQAPASSHSSSLSASSTSTLKVDPQSVVMDRLVKRFAGTYNYDELFKEAAVDQALRQLLKEDYKHFEENMGELRSPIDVVAGDLAVYGSRNSVPARESAFACIEFHPLRVHAGIFSNNEMTIFTEQSEYRLLPTCLHQWVYFSTMDQSALSKAPAQNSGAEFTFQYKIIPVKK